MEWPQLLKQWSLIEADLHSEYGIDLDEPAAQERTWRWLRVRILGLLTAPTPTRLSLALQPRKPEVHHGAQHRGAGRVRRAG